MCGLCSMRIPRICAAALSALRQWLTVRFARRARAVEAVRKADQGRRHAVTHCAGQAATEWTARADAPDVIEGGRQSAGAKSPRVDQRLQGFQRLYNDQRPHQALDNATPADRYTASPRRYDRVLREPCYGVDHLVRRVRHNGEIKWNGSTIYITEALVREPIGLLEDDARRSIVSYSLIELRVITHRGDRLNKPKRKSCGLVDNAKTRCPQGPQFQQQQT